MITSLDPVGFRRALPVGEPMIQPMAPKICLAPERSHGAMGSTFGPPIRNADHEGLRARVAELEAELREVRSAVASKDSIIRRLEDGLDVSSREHWRENACSPRIWGQQNESEWRGSHGSQVRSNDASAENAELRRLLKQKETEEQTLLQRSRQLEDRATDLERQLGEAHESSDDLRRRLAQKDEREASLRTQLESMRRKAEALEQWSMKITVEMESVRGLVEQKAQQKRPPLASETQAQAAADDASSEQPPAGVPQENGISEEAAWWPPPELTPPQQHPSEGQVQPQRPRTVAEGQTSTGAASSDSSGLTRGCTDAAGAVPLQASWKEVAVPVQAPRSPPSAAEVTPRMDAMRTPRRRESPMPYTMLPIYSGVPYQFRAVQENQEPRPCNQVSRPSEEPGAAKVAGYTPRTGWRVQEPSPSGADVTRTSLGPPLLHASSSSPKLQAPSVMSSSSSAISSRVERQQSAPAVPQISGNGRISAAAASTTRLPCAPSAAPAMPQAAPRTVPALGRVPTGPMVARTVTGPTAAPPPLSSRAAPTSSRALAAPPSSTSLTLGNVTAFGGR